LEALIQKAYSHQLPLLSLDFSLPNSGAEALTKYPDKTDAEIFDILLNGFSNMSQNNPQTWQRWQDIFNLLFAGGVEGIKIVCPPAGIPIEVGRKLYDIYDRNRKQLPGA
jgi:hypothetical protein